MLQLKKIIKDYKVADTTVHALRGIDLRFRKNEFVSILGPSGCGKTTLLNIIGGLDHYTDGEMFINGVSTKQYNDRDWDNYRNHSIGFVFQSYNLIPHQTISENVELALSISGMDKAERVRRAHEALDKVGLKGQYRKKPNQLSGGQCQRVAIARAIVNEPEILLADEPTGALDTNTSVQIMDIIKEIADERLVIMVTHNPDLANQYSTRIINLLDGEVQHDSNPYNGGEPTAVADEQPAVEEQTADTDHGGSAIRKPAKEIRKKKKTKKAKLSVWGAFKLSARNLWSKVKRTILVCIAGSIGIVGVATVLAVSSGVSNYIVSMQDDMLSGNPVSISAEAMNMEAIVNAMNNMTKLDTVGNEVKDGYINVDKMVQYLVDRGSDMANVIYTNNITDTYIKYVDQMPSEYYAAIVKSYGLNLSNNVYTNFDMVDGSKQMSLSAANTLYANMLSKTEYAQYAAYISMFTESFSIAPNNRDYILSQYDMLGENGKFATAENEIMLVVSDETALTDLFLAQFGYYSQDEFINLVENAVDPENNPATYRERFSYDDLIGKTFTWYPNDTIYAKAEGPLALGPFTYSPVSESNWQGGVEMKISAILRPKQNVSYGALTTGVYYTEALLNKALQDGRNSAVVQYLNEDNGVNSYSVTVENGQIKNPQSANPVTYTYSFAMRDKTAEGGIKYYKYEMGIVGSMDTMKAMIGAMTDGLSTVEYVLTKNDLGGATIPTRVVVYPISFDDKDLVTDYLDEWNGDKTLTIDGAEVTAEDRTDIMYTDNLEIIINLINEFINIITIALIAFTALSLVVSTVMIAIITYVSVIERIKEIGVIRSLGGRKRDISNLFIAETFIIGSISGIFGIAVTYAVSGVLNLILGSLFGIYTIAALPVLQALLMVGISIVLTLISGLVPASLAAKKDPVESLRSE